MYTDLLANPYVDSKLLAWYDYKYWYIVAEQLRNLRLVRWTQPVTQDRESVTQKRISNLKKEFRT
jgi:hypothetical protein